MRVLKYLKSSNNLALHFNRQGKPDDSVQLQAYSDADWAGDVESRRSTTGFVFTLCGSAVTWRSKLQTSVALSTCEAEVVALSETAREAIWLHQLGQELGFLPNTPVVIHEDNQAALQLVADQRFSERTKHVAIRHFFVREQVARGTLSVTYCPTSEMIADIFTKPLARILFERLRLMLGLKPKK